MASSSLEDFVVLVFTRPNSLDANITDEEIFISTEDIHSWDLPELLRHQTVKIEAHRNRLIAESSYFRGLLSGSFSESSLDCISIQWNLETFLNLLMCTYGCPLHVTSDNFLLLFEAALYFGVEMLLLKCKTWFSEVTSSKGPGLLQIGLDKLIRIWNFGLEHADDFVPELCAGYLARNFMWAMSSKFFGEIPYNLLLLCIKHPHLTVESEMHLCNAILVWFDADTKRWECSSKSQDYFSKILKQIRVSLLPLWFAAGKRRSHYLSELADESIDSIFRLVRIPSTGLITVLGDGDLSHLRIRLTEYSETLNLSDCPQIMSAILFLSILPSSYSKDPTLKKSIKQFLINLERVDKNQYEISQALLPTLSFERVTEVNISKCMRLNLGAAIECFSKSFPSLRILKAAHLLNFKAKTLYKLVQKCSLVCEVDLTVDITPVIPALVSVLSSSPAKTQLVSNQSLNIENDSADIRSSYQSGPSLSNVTRLTLEGRSDIYDSDLQCISKFGASLCYLNLKGCISVTDGGISNLIRRCIQLHSVVVCHTSFGMNSVLALCSSNPTFGDCPATLSKKKPTTSLAPNLEILHMGGCKGVDEASLQALMSQTQSLRSLCLRDTHLVDAALFNFSGSSLEMLDVSNTTISGASVAHIARGNPGLKCFKARGCRNLHQQESNTRKANFAPNYLVSELVTELGKTNKLEEIAMGWGFAYFSVEALRPAIMSLRRITVGLGGSLGDNALRLLPLTCPSLESISLHFQVISDCIVTNIIASLENLQILALCYCLGDISMSSFNLPMPNLRKLRLERVTPWMTNDHLFILTQNCRNLIELSLVGCVLLNSDSQQIISFGWSGLISLHLEDCGEVTARGVSSLFGCIALEDLLLRHNGPGIQRNFILDAASKIPMLRRISLDLCDASEGDFNIPDFDDRCFLSTVKIARCKHQRCGFNLEVQEVRRRLVHKETLVLAWSSRDLTRTVVKERL